MLTGSLEHVGQGWGAPQGVLVPPAGVPSTRRDARELHSLVARMLGQPLLAASLCAPTPHTGAVAVPELLLSWQQAQLAVPSALGPRLTDFIVLCNKELTSVLRTACLQSCGLLGAPPGRVQARGRRGPYTCPAGCLHQSSSLR